MHVCYFTIQRDLVSQIYFANIFGEIIEIDRSRYTTIIFFPFEHYNNFSRRLEDINGNNKY